MLDVVGAGQGLDSVIVCVEYEESYVHDEVAGFYP